jgi:hypothetical protein
MADRWLEKLQNTPYPFGGSKTVQKAAPKAGPNVPLEFVDLFKTSDYDDDVDVAVISTKVYDSDVDDAYIPEPIREYVERGRFLPEAAAPLAKRAAPSVGTPLQLFVKLSKVDEERREVTGIATSETPDHSDEVCDYEASKPFFKAWSESVEKDTQGKSKGNIREMHGLSAVGTLADIGFDDIKKQIAVCAKIIDDNAWKKVKAGVYSGFSVGGKYERIWKDGKLTRYAANPIEISLVDRPCNPNAVFQMIKAGGVIEVGKFADAPESSTILKILGIGVEPHVEELSLQ